MFRSISRASRFNITGLVPNTEYLVGIQTKDSSSQMSRKVQKRFLTGKKAGITFSIDDNFMGY